MAQPLQNETCDETVTTPPSSSSSSSSSSSTGITTKVATGGRLSWLLQQLRRWLLRPSLWTALISVVAYWDHTALHGKLVYDDAGSIRSNVVVNGHVHWTEAFKRDFWGVHMSEPQSHKSFRPITTLSFRLNWVMSEWLGTNGTDDFTYGFHLVNLGLHGAVTGLVTESAAFVFHDPDAYNRHDEMNVVGQLITGFLFGLHPVHAEAVSNITSRGELLMSLFFLLAFLSFASHVPRRRDKSTTTLPTLPDSSSTTTTTTSSFVQSCVFLYIVPWFCMTVSLFCKEQGATALMTLVAYDFLQNHSSVLDYIRQLLQDRNPMAYAFIRRTIILALQTILVVLWRYWLNGASSPDFIYDQNPAGFSPDRFTRLFSLSWVYCLYIWDAIYPRYLGPDWSGVSIDLIKTWSDHRVLYVLALWTMALACVVSLVVGNQQIGIVDPRSTRRRQKQRRIMLLAVLAFLFIPFLLSSNLLVVVGLMKADRVIYLPLMGFSLLEALLFQILFCDDDDEDDGDGEEHTNNKSTTTTTPREAHAQRRSAWSAISLWLFRRLPGTRIRWIGYGLVLLQLLLFAGKVHERNMAWSHSLNLWMKAYQVNPKSHHTMYNCGYELSLAKRYAEAEQVLRPIADAHVDGPSNTFVYVMVLFNLHRCEEAHPLIDRAIRVIEEKRASGGIRNTQDRLKRTESNLLVARAYCTEDIVLSGQIMYQAVQTDPTNAYALEQASEMLKRVTLAKQAMAQRMMIADQQAGQHQLRTI